MADLLCPVPGCSNGLMKPSDPASLHVTYTTSDTPSPTGNSPDLSSTRSWIVGCSNGHVILTSDDSPFGCEGDYCGMPDHEDNRCGHGEDDVDTDDHHTFRSRDYDLLADRVERMRLAFAAVEGQPLDWVQRWSDSQRGS